MKNLEALEKIIEQSALSDLAWRYTDLNDEKGVIKKLNQDLAKKILSSLAINHEKVAEIICVVGTEGNCLPPDLTKEGQEIVYKQAKAITTDVIIVRERE